jgi:hypothetical protein
MTGSKSLIWAINGLTVFKKRSLLLPNTLVNTLSTLAIFFDTHVSFSSQSPRMQFEIVRGAPVARQAGVCRERFVTKLAPVLFFWEGDNQGPRFNFRARNPFHHTPSPIKVSRENTKPISADFGRKRKSILCSPAGTVTPRRL